jgi:hypothetical protein
MKINPQSTINSAGSYRPKQLIRNLSRQPVTSKPWKIGKYWDNSGTQNPVIRKNNSDAKLEFPRNIINDKPYESPLQPYHAGIKYKTPEKPYSSNCESGEGWNPKYHKHSMINYQARNYDLITNTISNISALPKTVYKQKGFSELIDTSRPHNKIYNPVYQEAYRTNPKTFYRHTGEFTGHNDSCVKLSGFGPFHKALS